MKTVHPLIEYLGLQNAGPESEVLNKIFKDNLVTLRSQELMIAHFGFAAIQNMNILEREALKKRVSSPPPDKVRWTVDRYLRSGRPLICARWRAQEIFFDGPPENAPLVELHGEYPSPEILTAYAAIYDPNNAATLDLSYWTVRASKH